MRRDPLLALCLWRFFAGRERAVCLLLLEPEDEQSLGCLSKALACRRAAAAAVARAAASSAPLPLAASTLLSAELAPGSDIILVK